MLPVTRALGISPIFFDVTTAISNASWRLVDPFDNVLFSTNLNQDQDTLTLAQLAPLIPYLLLVAMLALRPRGLFGRHDDHA